MATGVIIPVFLVRKGGAAGLSASQSQEGGVQQDLHPGLMVQVQPAGLYRVLRKGVTRPRSAWGSHRAPSDSPRAGRCGCRGRGPAIGGLGLHAPSLLRMRTSSTHPSEMKWELCTLSGALIGGLIRLLFKPWPHLETPSVTALPAPPELVSLFPPTTLAKPGEGLRTHFTGGGWGWHCLDWGT